MSSLSNSPDSSVPIQTLLLIAASYTMLGALGLSLAIPPGYASPVFPAAGLSLAVALRFGRHVLPAIWLGSLLLNVGVAMSNGNLSSSTVLVAAGVGTGASLQAELGRFLINRWSTKKWQHLEQEKDIFQFSLLGGVLACLISATLGLSCLMLVGIVPPVAFGYAWWTWYVGDTLGVLISAPLIIGVLLRRHSDWDTRLKAMLLPVLGMLLLAFTAFVGTARWENGSQQTKLYEQGNLVATVLEHRFIAHRETLAALARAIEVIPELSLSQFEHFASATLQVQPDIFALSFNPRIILAQREEFECQMAIKYPEDKFQITERNTEHQLVRARERAEYITVGYISPLTGNRPAIGFDINSEPKRRDAITRAQQSRQTAATEPISLVQEKKERAGVLLLAPAFQQRKNSLAPAPEHVLIGFVVAVIKVDEMIDIALKGLMSPGLIVSIEDLGTDTANQVLYRSDSKTVIAGQEPAWQKRLMMADREWTLKLFVTEAYVQQQRSWIAWGVGIVGLLLVGLLQSSMLAMTCRTALIARQVSEQTEEINTKNTALTKSEEKYRSVVESIKEIIFQTDAEGFWTFLNPAWTEVMGFTVKDSLGELFLDYVHPDDRQRNIELFETLIQRKQDSYRHVTRYLRQDGGFCWIEVYARLTLNANDQIIGTAGTLLDVTERRMGEETIQKAAEEIEDLYNHAPCGYHSLNADAVFIRINDTELEWLGYERDEVIGKLRLADIVTQESRVKFEQVFSSFKAQGKTSEVELEMIRKNGSVLSVLVNACAVFDPDGHFLKCRSTVLDITARKQAQDQIRQLAYFDSLTELPNRQLLLDRLRQTFAQAKHFRRAMAVMFLDLDHFKQINDSLGHAAGDEVLKAVAKRITGCIRNGDTTARQGGDEFVIVLAEIAQPQDAAEVAKKVIAALNQPIFVKQQKLHISASIGIAVYPLDETDDILELLKKADTAMYSAKEGGRNRICFHHPDLDHAVAQKNNIDN